MIHESKYLLERRAKLLGTAPPKEERKPKPISIKSVKRKVEEKLYLKKKKEYLTKHIKCEVKGCNHVSEDLHHKCGRTGKLLYDERFFMAVCRGHHRRIEDDPSWAKENGYSLDKHKI